MNDKIFLLENKYGSIEKSIEKIEEKVEDI